MKKNQAQQLMEELAKDLVVLENIPDLDPEILESITKAYEDIYKDLIEIQRL